MNRSVTHYLNEGEPIYPKDRSDKTKPLNLENLKDAFKFFSDNVKKIPGSWRATRPESNEKGSELPNS